jgi:uncharacterized protein
MPTDPTFLGVVQDVRGATVSVALDEGTLSGLAFIDGAGYRIGQVGTFARIPMGYVDLYGVVSQVGAGAVPERLADVEPYGRRWMTLQLVGEGARGGPFARGLSQYPTIGDTVHLVDEEDLASIYGRGDAPEQLEVGRLASAESLPALVDVNRLVMRHSAVVGATGAGKSTLVASLIAAVSGSARFPNARVIVLDTHGEYARALRDIAAVFRVAPAAGERGLSLPYWAMTSDELINVAFGHLEDAARGAVLERVLALKRETIARFPRAGITNELLTADSPVPFSIHRLWFELHETVNATHTEPATAQTDDTRAYLTDETGQPVDLGDALAVRPAKYQPQKATAPRIYLSGSPLNIRRQLDALASRLRDPRYDFLFRPGRWLPQLDGGVESDLDELLKGWLGADKPVAVLDLSGIPSTILVDLVGSLLRMIYEALFWARYLPEGGRRRPLLFVLEEAHAYLGRDGPQSAATAVRRIVKEGRKYGIGAMIVSQRPSEIDQTILSQCGTIFAMRLGNAMDRGHVTASVADSLEGLLATLPILRTGEAIIVGESVQLPVRMTTDPRAPRPESEDPEIYDSSGRSGWNHAPGERRYDEVAAAWRGMNVAADAERDQ